MVLKALPIRSSAACISLRISAKGRFHGGGRILPSAPRAGGPRNSGVPNRTMNGSASGYGGVSVRGRSPWA